MNASSQVLTTAALFHHIQTFAPSTPWCILMFESAYREKHGFILESLPKLAVRIDDFDALKEFYKLLQSNPRYFSSRRLSFASTTYAAVARNRTDILKWLLDNKVEADTRSMLVECAISYASLDCLRVIHAARPKTKTRSTLAVDIAIENSDCEVVHYIVENKLGPWSQKILDKICLKDKIDTARLLLEHGSIKPSEHVLDRVAECGQFEMVKLLHMHGASCTSFVLREAAGNGYIDVVRFLCEHRSECNESDALIRAAEEGQIDVVEYLLKERRVPCTAQVLYEAIAWGQIEMVKYLVENTTAGRLTQAKVRTRAWNQQDILSMLVQMAKDGVTRVDRYEERTAEGIDVKRQRKETCLFRFSRM